MKNKQFGAGNTVPPIKEHVIIYFSQKNVQEIEALNFYNHFNKRKWKNNRNRKVNNWKVIAWEWILNFTSNHQKD